MQPRVFLLIVAIALWAGQRFSIIPEIPLWQSATFAITAALLFQKYQDSSAKSEGVPEVTSLIASKALLVVSKTFCPHCKRTKQVLDGYKMNPDKFKWLDIDIRSDMDAIQSQMKQITGGSSVPRVFIGGKFVGGADDTVAAHKSGKLEQMLKEAGALL